MRRSNVGVLPEALVLHVPQLDAQHEALFVQLDTLKAHCLETNQLPVEQADELLAALLEHFATEEQLAGAASLPFSDHAEKHRELQSILTKAFAEVREGKREIFSLLRYIDYWFERHISEEDRHFSARLPRDGMAAQAELEAA